MYKNDSFSSSRDEKNQPRLRGMEPCEVEWTMSSKIQQAYASRARQRQESDEEIRGREITAQKYAEANRQLRQETIDKLVSCIDRLWPDVYNKDWSQFNEVHVGWFRASGQLPRRMAYLLVARIGNFRVYVLESGLLMYRYKPKGHLRPIGGSKLNDIDYENIRQILHHYRDAAPKY